MGAAYAGRVYAHRRDLGVLSIDVDAAIFPVKSMDTLGALALRPDESVAHEDFDFARAITNGENGLGISVLRRDSAALNVDADIALGTDMKSIDAVGVSALGGDGDVA